MSDIKAVGSRGPPVFMRGQRRRRRADEDLLRQPSDLQRDIEADDSEPVDDDAVANERAEPV